ncbi:MAG: C25 family cysteine peptidase [Pirellulales bacterium]
MSLRIWISCLSLCWIAISYSEFSLAADTLVVRPKAWSDSLREWKQYREKQGHQILELDAELGATELKKQIRQTAQQNQLAYILLAGDVQSGVPTFYHPSTAMIQFGGTPSLASDHDYGDLNDDGTPELSVGRIPAQSIEQLKSFLARVMTYENNPDFSSWRRDVHVVAGVGGFGVVTDSVIEMTTRKFLSETVPAWVNLSMTQASLSSLYCPDPLTFCDSTLDRMNDGGAFWVYIGHGWIDQLDTIRVGNKHHPIFLKQHVKEVQVKQPPIAIFLACYTGAVDAKDDCLAEQLILNPTGPIAAIAATRVSGPYGLAILSDGLLRGYFEQKIETLGSLMLEAEKASLDDSRFAKLSDSKSQLGMINSIATAMTPKGYDLKAERQEHVWQMNLLGDPLMRLAHSSDLNLQIADQDFKPGDMIPVQIPNAQPGKLTLEFARRRGVASEEAKAAKVDWKTEEGRAAFQQRYQFANQQTMAQANVVVGSSPSAVNLTVPEKIRSGKYVVRAFLETTQGFQVGSAEVRVAVPQTSAP